MPELPEVETVVRGLRPVLEGARLDKVIQRRADLRFTIPTGFVRDLQGAALLSVKRRAKYVMAQTDRGQTLMIHLGMSGRMTVTGDTGRPFEKHDHLIFQTGGNPPEQVRFHDPRRFGFVDLFQTDTAETHPRLVNLGPEPLSNAFNGPYLAKCLKGLRAAIKTVIMDQKRVVGVGNIYACESLFKARISPFTPAGSLNAAQCEDLCGSIKTTLTRAIAAGGSSLNDYVQASGELGYFQHAFRVYGRENQPCNVCKTPLLRRIQAQRSSFYCKLCQSA